RAALAADQQCPERQAERSRHPRSQAAGRAAGLVQALSGLCFPLPCVRVGNACGWKSSLPRQRGAAVEERGAGKSRCQRLCPSCCPGGVCQRDSKQLGSPHGSGGLFSPSASDFQRWSSPNGCNP
uniref:Uncharacterized protein n=1 Tax=Apteryx owenii TaxID=8824 RepID=A0A8B9Q8F4_APTOW